MSLGLIREQIDEIIARVQPTICHTAGNDAHGGIRHTIEGRISSDDFNTLVGYAMAACLAVEEDAP